MHISRRAYIAVTAEGGKQTTAAKFELHHSDSKEFLRKYPANSVDVIFTSPNPIRAYVDFIEIMIILAQECKRILKPTGNMWVHMEDRFDDNGSLMRWPAKFSLEMVSEYNWIMRGERIWHLPVGDMGYFNEGKAVDNNRLILDHAYVYHFTKARYGYYNDFTEFQGQPCSIFTEKRSKIQGTEEYEPGFSAELVKQSLLMSCPDDGTILDPFCGWGTTGVVALLMKDKNYNFVGIDLDETRLITAQKRLEDITRHKQ